MSRKLLPNSDAWGGAWGAVSAWGGSWGWSWGPLHEVEEHPEYDGGPNGRASKATRNPRHKIREADARKDYYFQKPTETNPQDGIAIPFHPGYDSIGAQVAPKVGTSPALTAVAPDLKDVANGIQITQQILHGITSAAALKSRQRQDDEAAALALFALMLDDD